MALGDKRPVVMGAEKAAPGGVATLDADGKLDAAQRPSLAEIQGGSNPNLLINWDFRDPVNRNGLEQYPKGVNLDRWICDGEVTLNDGYITVGSNFYQIIPEQEASQYLGKQVTLSVLYHNGTLESGTITFPSAFPDTTQGINVPGTTNLAIALYANKRIQIFRLNGGPHEVVAVKTELGAHQTLAWQNEEGAWELIDPPDYALQYALCSQYSPITGEFVGSQQSNENLLDNWYFANKDIIINQRNQIEYIGQFYTIDRWVNRGANTKITLQDDGIKYTFGVEIGGFNQSIENPKKLVGKTVTCSILVDENTNDSTLRFGLNAATSPYAHSSIICAVYIPAGATGLFSTTGKISDSIINDTRPYLNFGILKTNLTGSTLKIQAAKLELGSVQTLAHKEGDTWVLNDPPPNKALELAKCQRYQLMLTGPGNAMIGSGIVNAGKFWWFSPTPVSMRSKPTVVIAGNGIFAIGKSETNITLSNTNVYCYTNNSVKLVSVIAGGSMEAGETGIVQIVDANPRGSVLLDANL